MLYWLAEWLGFPGVLNLIRYLSFRSGAAVAPALLIGLWIGPRFILMLRMRQGAKTLQALQSVAARPRAAAVLRLGMGCRRFCAVLPNRIQARLCLLIR